MRIRSVSSPTTATGLDCDALRALAREVTPAFTYLIPTFQNPSGLCYSRTAREEVARTLDELNIPLIEDEPYRELCYDEVDRTPVCALVERTSWVYMGTFSKTFCPGLRIGWLACSPDIMPQFVKVKQSADLHSSAFDQAIIDRYMDEFSLDEHVKEINALYGHRRDLIIQCMEKEFTDGTTWTHPEGGLFLWLGEFDTLQEAVYHSGVNFATLGYGDIVMSPQWKMLGPLEAVNGALMIGLSGASMLAVLQHHIRKQLNDGAP